MITTKIGQRGQITIPRAIRRIVGLQEGDSIALIPAGDQVILRPITKTLLDLHGSVPVSTPQDFEAVRKIVQATHSRDQDRNQSAPGG
jgi:AbrB family looped-hinge helix DNA binding protein